MGSKVQIPAILSFLCLFASAMATPPSNAVFNVMSFGAKADARTDISKALTAAWGAACSSKTPSTVTIPKGTFMMGAVTLKGPCSSPIKLQVQGILKAPANPGAMNADAWIKIGNVNQLTVYGGGTFDGQGQQAWNQNTCKKNFNCKQIPMNLRLDFVTNSSVVGLTSLDSKQFHVNVLGCKNLSFERFTIIAPAESLNTDGIHIGRSDGVNIIDSKIGTGDDCISIGDGSQNVRITRVTCGPGHGISVGSLGRYPNELPVKGIFVNDCTMNGTDNGVRVKSWPAMYGGSASDMHFNNVVMNNVANPVIIDQVYCPWNQCNKKAASKVKISDVSFTNIRGTTTTPVAVQLSCSSGLPCQNVKLSGINLAYTGTQGSVTSQCSNVKPIVTGVLKPSACGHA